MSPQIEARVLWMKVNFCYEDLKVILLLKHWYNSTEKEAYTKFFFLLLKSHKHSVCLLLYSKTCKISTFIKGPLFLCLLLILFRVFFCFVYIKISVILHLCIQVIAGLQQQGKGIDRAFFSSQTGFFLFAEEKLRMGKWLLSRPFSSLVLSDLLI